MVRRVGISFVRANPCSGELGSQGLASKNSAAELAFPPPSLTLARSAQLLAGHAVACQGRLLVARPRCWLPGQHDSCVIGVYFWSNDAESSTSRISFISAVLLVGARGQNFVLIYLRAVPFREILAPTGAGQLQRARININQQPSAPTEQKSAHDCRSER